MLEAPQSTVWTDEVETAAGDGSVSSQPDAPGRAQWMLETLDADTSDAARRSLRKDWETLHRDGFQWPGSPYCSWVELAHVESDLVLATYVQDGHPKCMMAFRKRKFGPFGSQLIANLHAIAPYAAWVGREPLSRDALSDLDRSTHAAGYRAAVARGIPTQQSCVGASRGNSSKLVTNIVQVRHSTGDAWKDLSKNRRKTLKGGLRRLKEMGRVETNLVQCNDSQFARLFDHLLSWKRAWLDENGFWGGAVRGSAFVDFAKFRREHAPSTLALHVLSVDSRPISLMLLTLAPKLSEQKSDGSVASALLAGHDEGFRSISPAALHYGLIFAGRSLPKDLGAVDFLPNHEEFKSAYGAEPYVLGTLESNPSGRYSISTAFSGSRLRGRVRMALESLPILPRRMLVGVLVGLRTWVGPRKSYLGSTKSK